MALLHITHVARAPGHLRTALQLTQPLCSLLERHATHAHAVSTTVASHTTHDNDNNGRQRYARVWRCWHRGL